MVVVENIDSSPQSEYYFPFGADTIGHVGGFEARDKKEPSKAAFPAEVVEYDPFRWAAATLLTPYPRLDNVAHR